MSATYDDCESEHESLSAEWADAKRREAEGGPKAARCGERDRSLTPWRRCVRPEGHGGRHYF